MPIPYSDPIQTYPDSKYWYGFLQPTIYGLPLFFTFSWQH